MHPPPRLDCFATCAYCVIFLLHTFLTLAPILFLLQNELIFRNLIFFPFCLLCVRFTVTQPQLFTYAKADALLQLFWNSSLQINNLKHILLLLLLLPLLLLEFMSFYILCSAEQCQYTFHCHSWTWWAIFYWAFWVYSRAYSLSFLFARHFR